MTRTEWEREYMSQLGDTGWNDAAPDHTRLERIERTIGHALSAIDDQVKRIKGLQRLKREYVPLSVYVDLSKILWSEQKVPPDRPYIPEEEATHIVNQMCLDTLSGDLRWFPLTPGIGLCYGVAECKKKDDYLGFEFGNYCGTIYDPNLTGQYSLSAGSLRGWISVQLGEKLLTAIKQSMDIK
jgi:hypothetical protein